MTNAFHVTVMLLALLILSHASAEPAAQNTTDTTGPGDSLGCTDSDEDFDIYTKGSVTADGVLREDYCSGETTLYEARCGDGSPYYTHSDCKLGCSDGACVRESSVCAPEDGDRVYTGQGAFQPGDFMVVSHNLYEYVGVAELPASQNRVKLTLRDTGCEYHELELDPITGDRIVYTIKQTGEALFIELDKRIFDTTAYYGSFNNVDLLLDGGRLYTYAPRLDGEICGNRDALSWDNNLGGRLLEDVNPLICPNLGRCDDSDGGQNPYEKGTVLTPDESFYDVCFSEGELVEYYCAGESAKSARLNCSGSCSDGACVKGGDELFIYDEYPTDALEVANIPVLAKLSVRTRGGSGNGMANCSYKYGDMDYAPFEITGDTGHSHKLMFQNEGLNIVYVRCADPSGAEDYSKISFTVDLPDDCDDSDGGLSFYKAGSVASNGRTIEDRCVGGALLEAFCSLDVGEMPPAYDCEAGACTAEYYCQHGCENGACMVKVMPDTVRIRLFEGWNLVALPGGGTLEKGSCDSIVGFVMVDGEYHTLQEASGMLGGDLMAYLSIHAFWVHTGEYCRLQFKASSHTSPDGLSLDAGWNLVPVARDMVGKSMSGLSGDCVFTEYYLWDAAGQEWEGKDSSYKFTESERYGGVLLKAEGRCDLAPSESQEV
ncbi:MAG: hypothetical protein GF416_02920 [Candidatus Altiarchaeales archaeon]|nr:hypothetical protein [Candidatus Altiarchaeales archaeon]MBD3416072.1 hypothetical protein [Candidatus Altiarchaeales archaeon]